MLSLQGNELKRSNEEYIATLDDDTAIVAKGEWIIEVQANLYLITPQGSCLKPGKRPGLSDTKRF